MFWSSFLGFLKSWSEVTCTGVWPFWCLEFNRSLHSSWWECKWFSALCEFLELFGLELCESCFLLNYMESSIMHVCIQRLEGTRKHISRALSIHSSLLSCTLPCLFQLSWPPWNPICVFSSMPDGWDLFGVFLLALESSNFFQSEIG